MLLAGNFYEFVPVGCHLLHVGSVGIERHHSECFALLRMTRADVGAVAATQTVEHAGLDDEVHALHGGGSFHLEGRQTVEAGQLVVGQHKRTDGCVRTDIGALVTLDTVL